MYEEILVQPNLPAEYQDQPRVGVAGKLRRFWAGVFSRFTTLFRPRLNVLA